MVPKLTEEIREYYRKNPNLTRETRESRSYRQLRLARLLDDEQPEIAESCGLQRKFKSRVASIFSAHLHLLALRREEVLDNLGRLFSDHGEGGIRREESLPLTDYQMDSIASYLSAWSPRSRSSKLELQRCDDRLDHLSCVPILPPPDFPS